VYFAECSLFYRALSQKRPVILRHLLTIAISFHGLRAQCPVFLRKREREKEREKERERGHEKERGS